MTVLFVAPLPPPVHGFSLISAAMLGRLQAQGAVEVFDRAPPRVAGSRGAQLRRTVFGTLAGFGRFAGRLVSKRGRSLYLALSGARGQWLDVGFLVLARLFRLPAFVHHHSFAYLNQPTLVARICMRASSTATHIVLCELMREKLTHVFGLPPDRVMVLSNAAFMPADDAAPSRPEKGREGAVTVGFLSNITEEKGIFDVFAAVQAAERQGLDIDLLIAGPVESSIEVRFRAELAKCRAARHVGPVYGDAKRAFLQSIDLLLFPTRYLNEAEPVTILEALRDGVEVLGARRGCIDDQLARHRIRPVDVDVLVDRTVEVIAELTATSTARQMARKEAARLNFLELHEDGTKSMLRLLHLIGNACGAPAPQAR